MNTRGQGTGMTWIVATALISLICVLFIVSVFFLADGGFSFDVFPFAVNPEVGEVEVSSTTLQKTVSSDRNMQHVLSRAVYTEQVQESLIKLAEEEIDAEESTQIVRDALQPVVPLQKNEWWVEVTSNTIMRSLQDKHQVSKCRVTPANVQDIILVHQLTDHTIILCIDKEAYQRWRKYE